MMLGGYHAFAQLSPGDLSEAHAHLEGLSNCTQCHILGEKVSNDKCLACHTELKSRIDQQKGYHSSSDVKGKECIVCHSDHHGRKFEMIRFDENTFDHNLTGYELLGSHNKQACDKCHKKDFITENEIKKKNYTYLGLDQKCLTCHDDYHQNTLSSSCNNCHTFEKFKPASKFDHSHTKYPLLGKHATVECAKCHKIETRNNEKFQEFVGVSFSKCTDCHKDVHNNKFGQTCTKCHSEESFHIIKGINDFDHSKTDFKLVGKHRSVKCAVCHKTNYTDPIKHNRCADCHKDYHHNQFAVEGRSPDCVQCHNNDVFSPSGYTIEDHNKSKFKLEGAHLATPCFACHKKEDKWSFRQIGEKCNDCHQDIHKNYIDQKFYPGSLCTTCHDVNTWEEIKIFDHSKTRFNLTGAHKKEKCAACHFKEENGEKKQKFRNLSIECAGCHNDVHAGQFEVDGKVECTKCHKTTQWKPSTFDHNTAKFKLDGKHKDVACIKCHKPVVEGQIEYIYYKIEDFRCEACHK